jgi:hypothetical protein
MIDLPERQYCRCGTYTDARTFVELPKPPWFPKCEATRVYVCRICNKVSHAVEELVVSLRGPKNAMLLSVAGRVVTDTSVLRWRMPDSTIVETIEFKPYPRSDRMSETQNEPLLYALWRLLDEKVADVMVVAMDDERDPVTKGVARGVAEAIHLLMSKYYPTADDVAKEAVKRYKARQAEVEHETPGLGEYLFNPHFNQDGSERTKTSTKVAPKKAAFPKKPNGTIPEKAIEGIKAALEAGVFTEEQICNIYSVTPEQLKEVRR